MTPYQTLRETADARHQEAAFCKRAGLMILVCSVIALAVISQPNLLRDVMGYFSHAASNCRAGAQTAYVATNNAAEHGISASDSGGIDLDAMRKR